MSENIPIKPKKENKTWMNNEILGRMEERRKTKSVKENYKNLTNKIKRKCDKAKEKWINDQCLEIEIKQNSDSKYVHSKIKEISGKKVVPKLGALNLRKETC